MKVLFIHGLASSGTFKTSASLRSIFRPCEVITPDVPIDPDEAFNLLQGICSKEQPDHLPVHPELQKYLPEAYNNFVTVDNK